MLWHQMGNKLCSYPQFDDIFLSVLTYGNDYDDNNNNNNNNKSRLTACGKRGQNCTSYSRRNRDT